MNPDSGGKKILLFCGRVHRDDIEVHFLFPIKGKLYDKDMTINVAGVTFQIFPILIIRIPNYF